VTNTIGSALFTDPEASLSPQKFYSAFQSIDIPRGGGIPFLHVRTR